MEMIKEAQAYISQWLTYISGCAGADLQVPTCKPFWTWIAIGTVALGLLVVIWAAARLVSYKLKYAAARRAEEARMKVADEETLRKALWVGDRALPTDEGAGNVELQIRAALAERKKEGRKPPIV
jgi:hypothetical protein